MLKKIVSRSINNLYSFTQNFIYNLVCKIMKLKMCLKETRLYIMKNI